MSKPYAKLKRADLEEAPVWEWASEDEDIETDESFVRPCAHSDIPTNAFAQFAVAATIVLKDGSIMPGIAEVTVAEGAVTVRPDTVFLLDRHLTIPGMETNRLLTRYTKAAGNHPVGWTLAVPVRGETAPRTGKIRGGDMQEAVAAGIEALLALKALRKQDSR